MPVFIQIFRPRCAVAFLANANTRSHADKHLIFFISIDNFESLLFQCVLDQHILKYKKVQGINKV